MKARRSVLYHLLPPLLQQRLPVNDPNYHNYYGTVVQKSMGKHPSYDIKFDIFNDGEIARGLRRDTFKTVAKNEEEPPVDQKYLATKEMPWPRKYRGKISSIETLSRNETLENDNALRHRSVTLAINAGKRTI